MPEIRKKTIRHHFSGYSINFSLQNPSDAITWNLFLNLSPALFTPDTVTNYPGLPSFFPTTGQNIF
jgi:hypothetical protein